MKLIRLIKIVRVLVSIMLLFFLMSKSLSIDFEKHQLYKNILIEQREQDILLNENLLKARYDFFVSYDFFVDHLNRITKIQEELNIIPIFINNEGQQKIKTILAQKSKLIKKKESLIEQFKTQNALLTNSSRYLPELIKELTENIYNSFDKNDYTLVATLEQLLQNILIYHFTSDQYLIAEIQENLEQLIKIKNKISLTQENSLLVNLVIQHSQIILDNQLKVNQIMQKLLSMQAMKKSEELEANYNYYYQKAIKTANIYRFYTYCLILIILGCFAYIIVSNLVKTNHLMKKQALELEQTLHELKTTQSQLIQTEKMSSLGQMVAGVAHEINNPVNFIHGNLAYANEYIQDLLRLVNLYQQEYPYPSDKIADKIKTIDLHFLQEDLTKLLKSMRVGTERIREIVKSLRTFTRLDEAEVKKVNIHEGIDSTLMILQNRLKAKPNHPVIEVTKKYGKLPLINCDSRQLNQVFLNLLINAIDAIDEYNQKRSLKEIKANPSTIKILTEVINNNWIAIHIADNGSGISKEIRSKLFDPFFTTKPVGKGSGLGLFSSYQIVVEKHNGKIECISEPEKGTEFVIKLPI